MDTERSATIKIGYKEYQLILTTRASKQIAQRYGGLENLGEKLMKSENFEMAIEEIVWLIVLLANQSVLIYNLQNENKRNLITEDEVELLTSPLDLSTYKDAIMEAMLKGTKRILRARMPKEKTRRSGKRRRVVCPTFILRCDAAQSA